MQSLEYMKQQMDKRGDFAMHDLFLLRLYVHQIVCTYYLTDLNSNTMHFPYSCLNYLNTFINFNVESHVLIKKYYIEKEYSFFIILDLQYCVTVLTSNDICILKCICIYSCCNIAILDHDKSAY